MWLWTFSHQETSPVIQRLPLYFIKCFKTPTLFLPDWIENPSVVWQVGVVSFLSKQKILILSHSLTVDDLSFQCHFRIFSMSQSLLETRSMSWKKVMKNRTSFICIFDKTKRRCCFCICRLHFVCFFESWEKWVKNNNSSLPELSLIFEAPTNSFLTTQDLIFACYFSLLWEAAFLYFIPCLRLTLMQITKIPILRMTSLSPKTRNKDLDLWKFWAKPLASISRLSQFQSPTMNPQASCSGWWNISPTLNFWTRFHFSSDHMRFSFSFFPSKNLRFFKCFHILIWRS